MGEEAAGGWAGAGLAGEDAADAEISAAEGLGEAGLAFGEEGAVGVVAVEASEEGERVEAEARGFLEEAGLGLGAAGEPEAAGAAGEPEAAGVAGKPEAAGAAGEPEAAGAAGEPEAAGAAGEPEGERSAEVSEGSGFAAGRGCRGGLGALEALGGREEEGLGVFSSVTERFS